MMERDLWRMGGGCGPAVVCPGWMIWPVALFQHMQLRLVNQQAVLLTLVPVSLLTDVLLHLLLMQMYKTTGLIGLVGTASSNATAAADALTAKLKSLASSVGDAQLAAAKQHALSGYQSAISAKSGVVQDMGLSLLARGKFSAKEYAAAVSGLSGSDVSKYVGEVLKSPLTLVAVGSLASLPKYDTVAGRLTA